MSTANIAQKQAQACWHIMFFFMNTIGIIILMNTIRRLETSQPSVTLSASASWKG